MFVFNVFGIFASNNDKRMLNLEEIRKELGEYAMKDENCICYSIRVCIENFVINHFGRIPYLNRLNDRIFDKTNSDNIENYTECNEVPIEDAYSLDGELRERHQNIDMNATLGNILKAYPEAVVWQLNAGQIEDGVIFHDDFVYYDGIFYMDVKDIPQKMYDCVVKKENKPRIRWILRGNRGVIVSKFMDILPKGGMEMNYNDDFEPTHQKITELIHDDQSSIMILHGKPGTGKTSYIRELIAANDDIKFYWIDSSMFNYIDTSEFIEFLMTCKNAVFILEDSEALLTSRDETHNPAMQSLLSISDGMLGDSLKLKFICTFNTDVQNIDKAITRKGRMKIKYEFKDLNKDKVKKIFKTMGIDENLAKPMPLCDVYNYLEDNGNNPTNRKIGF